MTRFDLDKQDTAAASVMAAVLDKLDPSHADGPPLTGAAADKLRALGVYNLCKANAGYELSASPLRQPLPGGDAQVFNLYQDAEDWYRRTAQQLAAIVRLADLGGDDDLCYLLYAALEPMAASVHDLGTWGAMTPHALTAARRSGDLAALARTLLVAGAWHRLSGRPDAAAACYTEAIAICVSLGPEDELVAAALNRRGAALLSARRLDDAEQDFVDMAALADGRDPLMAGLAKMNLCSVAVARGQYARAVEVGLDADRMLTDSGADPVWHLETVSLLVEANIGSGELAQAEEYVIQVRDLLAKARMATVHIGALIVVGQLRLAQGRHSEALTEFLHALVQQAAGSPWRAADIGEGIARANLGLGSIDQSITGLQQVVAARRKTGEPFATARSLGLLADALRAAGQRVEAGECRSKALNELADLGDRAAAQLRAELSDSAN